MIRMYYVKMGSVFKKGKKKENTVVCFILMKGIQKFQDFFSLLFRYFFSKIVLTFVFHYRAKLQICDETLSRYVPIILISLPPLFELLLILM